MMDSSAAPYFARPLLWCSDLSLARLHTCTPAHLRESLRENLREKESESIFGSDSNATSQTPLA
jgi:hypothetical protein